MTDATLAVLAGGAGTRMGAPKAQLQLGGKSVLAYLLERFAWRGPTMLVSAPGMDDPPGAEKFNRRVCDPVAGLGPLRGVLTALENIETEIVVIVTVDMPGLTGGQLEWIARGLTDRPDQLGLMISRDGQIEPFPSAWRREAAAIVADQLAHNRRAVHGLLKLDRFSSVASPRDWPNETWINLNTPDDLRAFMQRLEAP